MDLRGKSLWISRFILTPQKDPPAQEWVATFNSYTSELPEGALTFDAELERATREQRPVTLAIIDIDHFKHVNDHWGHDAGDEVLRRITHSMLAAIRISDVLARVGGEEFALIMPGIRQVEARRAMQRLRIGIEQMTIPVEDEQLRVTVSIGMAVRDRAQLFSAEVLYKQADEALYRAKQAGRNRVELYEIPATEGLTPEERDALLR